MQNHAVNAFGPNSTVPGWLTTYADQRVCTATMEVS